MIDTIWLSRDVMRMEGVLRELSLVSLLVVLAVSPMFATACPKATHPVGGNWLASQGWDLSVTH